MNTPKLSVHARMRCLELGISTKRAKRIVRERLVTYAADDNRHPNDAVTAMSGDLEYAVVWDPATNRIITVVPRTPHRYRRTPTGFEVQP